MAKSELELQKKQEKKRASQLIEDLEIGDRLSAREQKLSELLNIQQMEEKSKARERLSALKAGKRVRDILGEYEEVVDLSPPKDENVEVVEQHPIKKPFSYVRILFDNNKNEYIYQVIEPTLSVEEQKIFEFLKETLIKTMDVEITEFTEDQAKDYLRKNVERILSDYSISIDDKPKEKIMYYIIRDFLGYGKIDVLMIDPMIEDISSDSAQVPIYIYHRNYESVRTNVTFSSDDELDSFVIQLAQKCGRHISIARPLMDATMPDGSRVQASLSKEVSSMGSNFTIRRFREEPFTPSHLVEYGTISPEVAAYFWMAVENGASAVLAGGTASGKTTSLNALSLFIPPQMKIISIEDTREINLPHPNWIASMTREGSEEAEKGATVGMFDLLKAALRQRPEYILVGEIRGEEAVVLFQAMATGHTVYSTMHADSIFSVVHRLEGDPINIPRVQLQALNIVAIQALLRIGRKRVRRIRKVVEVVGIDPGTEDILTNEVFSWNPRKDTFDYYGKGHVLDKVAEQRNWTDRELNEEFDRRRDVIKWMVDNDVKNYVDVGEILAAYYKDPDRVMKRVRGDGQATEPAPAETEGEGEPEPGEEGTPEPVPLTADAEEEEYPEDLDVEEIPAPQHSPPEADSEASSEQPAELEEHTAESEEREEGASHAAE